MIAVPARLGEKAARLFDNAISIIGLQWLDRNRERLRRAWTCPSREGVLEKR